jgi:hypothetical protein
MEKIMKRSTMLVFTFVFVMAGTMVLMQRLSAQQGPGIQPTNDPNRPATRFLVPLVETLPQQDHNLGQQALELLAKYQGTEDSQQREQMRAELQKIVSEQFELRQQLRQKELEQLEAQVRRLRNIHSRRQEEKEAIVRDRVQQLIRDAEGLGWGGDHHATRYEDMRLWPIEQQYPSVKPTP